jgi:hypothetical protein
MSTKKLIFSFFLETGGLVLLWMVGGWKLALGILMVQYAQKITTEAILEPIKKAWENVMGIIDAVGLSEKDSGHN